MLRTEAPVAQLTDRDLRRRADELVRILRQTIQQSRIACEHTRRIVAISQDRREVLDGEPEPDRERG